MNLQLNDKQKQAINTYDVPLLILAGAGTGKTTTITARIANLILNNVAKPEEILAVTFTNKASNEMKSRIEKLVGDTSSQMWVGTFHGISLRILKNYPKAIGLEPNFLIIDEADKKRLITQVMKDLNVDEKRFPYKVISFILSQLKEKCIDYTDEDKISTFKYKDLDIISIYKTYQTRLRAMNAVDFDDLIFETVRLFKKEPKVLKDIQDRFKFITVDEYQDTNELQHLWLRLLVGSNPNICCVGDEDQSIYGWRGAKVKYILQFADDFIGAKIIRLEDNYRSTQAILNSAMSVISNNQQRYNKVLKSNIQSQQKPILYIMENDLDENKQMAQTIIKNYDDYNVQFSDNAILVRATFQMKSIEDCFIKNKIPYKIIGGIKFYERKEIKDLIAYIRFAYSHNDLISLDRIINVPKRGIGEKTYEEMIAYIQKSNLDVLNGIKNFAIFGNQLNSKTSQQVMSFVDFVSNISNIIETAKNNGGEIDLPSLIEKIYHESGYAEMLLKEQESDPEVVSRMENIMEFTSSSRAFNTIEEFLENIALVSSADDNNTQNAVNIMTMHSAKGLEFKCVLLPAWEEGIFPSQKSIEENGIEGIEEERRLAYVALTRARQMFYVFSCKQRRVFNKIQICQPSRFIEEMKHSLQVEDKSYHKSNIKYSQAFGTSQSGNDYYINRYKTYGKRTSIKNNDYDETPIEVKQTNHYAMLEEEKKDNKLTIGTVVIHGKHGKGVIKGVFGKFYEVKFDNGEKRVLNDITAFDE